jgi:hypothetical protein
VLAIVVALVVAGQSSHSPTFSNGKAVPGASAAGTPSGYKSFIDRTDHFSIAVPAQWRQVDPSSPGAAAAFQQLAQDNPKWKAAIGSNLATLISRGMKFLATEPNRQAAVQSTVNVVVEPAPGIQDSDVTQLGDQASSELEKAGATVLGTRVITVDGHQALQVSISSNFKDPLGDNVTGPETQYYVGANDFAYIITLSGTGPELSTIVGTFRTQ